jgi:hypothetical protein
MRISVPAYFDPHSDATIWQRLLDVGSTVTEVVLNPASGPGDRSRSEYVQLADALTRRGIRTLGYVSTAYARRSFVEVQADIERWYAWYRIGGIFVDEVSCGDAEIDFYATISSLVHRRHGQVAFNPGTVPDPAYMQLCDVLVNWEGNWSTYLSGYPANPAWVSDFPADRFWHIVHGCPSARDMRQALGLARHRHAARIYVTSGEGANPYADLPAFWVDEARAVTDAAEG